MGQQLQFAFLLIPVLPSHHLSSLSPSLWPLEPAALAQIVGEKRKKKFNPTTINSQLLLTAFAFHILSQSLSEPQPSCGPSRPINKQINISWQEWKTSKPLNAVHPFLFLKQVAKEDASGSCKNRFLISLLPERRAGVSCPISQGLSAPSPAEGLPQRMLGTSYMAFLPCFTPGMSDGEGKKEKGPLREDTQSPSTMPPLSRCSHTQE